MIPSWTILKIYRGDQCTEYQPIVQDFVPSVVRCPASHKKTMKLFSLATGLGRQMIPRTIDVREIFCQGRQNTILRPNEILDRIFFNAFALFL